MATIPRSPSDDVEGIASRVMSKLDSLPANLPVSFFSLIHDMGFVDDDRDDLKSAVRRLARGGRVLMSHSDDDIDLSTPLLSSRLKTGSSTRCDAITVFGHPLSETSNETAIVLTYPLLLSRCRSTGDDQSLVGFRLHFDLSGLLTCIENFQDRAS